MDSVLKYLIVAGRGLRSFGRTVTGSLCGMTAIEYMIIVAILGIVAAIAIPQIDARKMAKLKETDPVAFAAEVAEREANNAYNVNSDSGELVRERCYKGVLYVKFGEDGNTWGGPMFRQNGEIATCE